MRELRLEVNLDIVKGDIDPERVRQAVQEILEEKLNRYIVVQTVLITR